MCVALNKGGDEHLRLVRLPAVAYSRETSLKWSSRAFASGGACHSLSPSRIQRRLVRVSDQLGGNHVFEHYEEETPSINVKKGT
ncbi:hypothetical protein QQF64_021916 [Cirrhinus molitorella]|uniref:Uncharacterized protein n=1 Tax=Cirrhinus molitorella TaxID=172907 RepID=A0ABR3LAP5_9TELE